MLKFDSFVHAGKKVKTCRDQNQADQGQRRGFIGALPDELKRKDSLVLLDMMQQASGEMPVLWGNSIIGLCLKRYESPTSRRQVDWFVIGFAPRKANLTLYLIDLSRHEAALQKLGKYKAGGGCLYLNKLADVDLGVLEGMIGMALK